MTNYWAEKGWRVTFLIFDEGSKSASGFTPDSGDAESD